MAERVSSTPPEALLSELAGGAPASAMGTARRSRPVARTAARRRFIVLSHVRGLIHVGGYDGHPHVGWRSGAKGYQGTGAKVPMEAEISGARTHHRRRRRDGAVALALQARLASLSTSSFTAAADRSKAACSSWVRAISMTRSIPVAPSTTGTPTKRPRVPN